VADYARDNQITTKNALADFFIKEIAIGTVQEKAKQKNAEKLELQRNVLQADLESNLSTQMASVRDQMLSENSQLMDKYFEAMIYEANYSRETYYASCYEYYKCFTEQIRSDYSYRSTSWYKPNCITPRETYLTVRNENDYIDVAFRKLDLYRKYNDEKFVSGINLFLDAGLAENKQNPKAYFLKSQLEEDIINKMFFTQLAFTLDSGNASYKNELKTISNSFNDDFFLAIRNENIDFISRSIEKGFHLGREKNGRSAIEAAIDYDKAYILELLINSTVEEKNSLSKNGNSLLFHACAVDALEAVKKLISLGVDPEFADKTYSGLTALNVAEKNNSEKVFLYLATNYNIKRGLLYARKSGTDDLESFSAKVYEAIPAKLDEIGSVNPKFRKRILGANYTVNDYNDTKDENIPATVIENNPITEKSRDNSNPENGQKIEYLESDPVTDIKAETTIVEKPVNIKETKSLNATSDLSNSRKPIDSNTNKINNSNSSETRKVRIYVTDFYNSPLTNITVFLFTGNQVQKKTTDSFGEVQFDSFPRDIIKVATADLSGSDKFGTIARKGYTEMLSNVRLKLPRFPTSSSESANMLDELVSVLLDASDLTFTLTKLKEVQSMSIPNPSSKTSIGTPGVFYVTPTVKDGKAGFILNGALVEHFKNNLNCKSARYDLSYWSGPEKIY
jgi:ankyrin repeat protein